VATKSEGIKKEDKKDEAAKKHLGMTNRGKGGGKGSPMTEKRGKSSEKKESDHSANDA